MEENEGGSKIWIGLVAAGVVAAAGGLYFGTSYFKHAEPAPVPQAAPKEESPLAKMTLEQGDALLKDRAKDFSSSALWAKWLMTEDLLRRVAAATALVAEGKSPRQSLEFIGPFAPFRAAKKGNAIVVDPRSYARYDALAGVVDSIDAQKAAAVVRELSPLFDKAVAELGGPQRSFQDVWLVAVNGLLSTPVVEGDIRVRKKVLTYVMTDDTLEKLSPAQKHLLRMGPKNSVKIQGKLRQIALALGAPEAKLAVPQTYTGK